ncbi:MAG: alpha/beta hydrolase fold domain-containing protein [Bryobacterales bacterium]|nr:alpha/beta hydrolase fold domain-containing protein [Bryobacterales bacterium]
MIFLWLLATATGLIAADITLERGVDYTSIPHGKLAMDIARPVAAGKYPGVVLIHGGGFSSGSRDSLLPMAERLARQGYVAATVSYRLAPAYQFPIPLFDIKAAVRFLRANAARLRLDKEHVGALGVSAGATYAQLLAVTRGFVQFEGNGAHRNESSSVDCAVSFYGRSDLRRGYEGSRNAAEALPPLLGGDRAQALDAHYRASPLHWVTPGAAPVLAIHGTRDANVPFEQSVWLVERMRSMGVEAELETIAEAGHGFKGADEERAFTRTLAFLDRHLKPKLLETRRLIVMDHGPGAELLAIAWPSGRVLWRRPNGRGTDAVVLPGSGNVLYVEDPKSTVTEVDGATGQRVVWQYKSAAPVSIVSVERLANGNTLLVDDAAPRVFEVSPDGRTVWEALRPEYKGKAMRRARRMANGNTMVAVQVAGVLLELDPQGRTLRTIDFARRLPAHAKPLADGGMLIGLAGPGEVRRVDARGATVATFPAPGSGVRTAWTSGFAETPEGGLIASDYQGGRIVEFDAKGQVVHQFKGFTWSVTSVGLLP